MTSVVGLPVNDVGAPSCRLQPGPLVLFFLTVMLKLSLGLKSTFEISNIYHKGVKKDKN